jgi:ABC-type lipoprotein export system ATPase subunit
MAAIDWDTTRKTTGYLSGGERRLLALADSLATGQHVDLADTLTGLDGHSSQAVVNALAHALRDPNYITGR